MREVKPTEKKKQEQTDETTAELLMLMQKRQEQTDEALAEIMLLIATGKEEQKMFTVKSQLVLTWVRLIKAGKYTKDEVPDISNLKEMTIKALEEA